MEEEYKELFEEEVQRDPSLEKKIKSNINRRIISKIVQVVLVIVIGLFVISKSMDYFCYNPYRLPTLVALEDGDNMHEANYYTSSILIEKFLSLYFPQVVYFGDLDIESKGFGRYTVHGTLNNRFKNWSAPGSETFDFHISPNGNTTDSSFPLYTIYGEFYNADTVDPFSTQRDMLVIDDAKKAEIENLPDSSLLDVSVSFVDSYTMAQTVEFINQYPDAYIFWMAIHNEQDGLPKGVTIMRDALYYDLTDETNKRYPYLYPATDEVTADSLKKRYTSTLRILLDNPDTLVKLQEAIVRVPLVDLEEHYQKVEKEGIDSIGIRGHFSKADVLALIDEGYSYMYIHDVKLSSLQSNYP